MKSATSLLYFFADTSTKQFSTSAGAYPPPGWVSVPRPPHCFWNRLFNLQAGGGTSEEHTHHVPVACVDVSSPNGGFYLELCRAAGELLTFLCTMQINIAS